MPIRLSHLLDSKSRAAGRILEDAIHRWNASYSEPRTPSRPRAFITVSREAGAGAVTFSHRLAERLNFEDGGDWSAWDQELVEKISAEHGISRHIVETLTDRPHSWLEQLVQTVATDQAGEFSAYKKVALTIRALAAAGHTIIVGRGGVFVTAEMPAGIHLRLVAPLEYRIQFFAQSQGLSVSKARERVKEIDHNRDAFFRRYWPKKTLVPESFTMTLNSGKMSLEELVECVLPVVRMHQAAPAVMAHIDERTGTVIGGATGPVTTTSHVGGSH